MPRVTGLSFSIPGLSRRSKNQAGDCGGHKVEGQHQVQTDEWVAHSNMSSQHQQCRWSRAEASLSRAETVLNFLPMSPLTRTTPDVRQQIFSLSPWLCLLGVLFLTGSNWGGFHISLGLVSWQALGPACPDRILMCSCVSMVPITASW